MSISKCCRQDLIQLIQLLRVSARLFLWIVHFHATSWHRAFAKSKVCVCVYALVSRTMRDRLYFVICYAYTFADEEIWDSVVFIIFIIFIEITMERSVRVCVWVSITFSSLVCEHELHFTHELIYLKYKLNVCVWVDHFLSYTYNCSMPWIYDTCTIGNNSSAYQCQYWKWSSLNRFWLYCVSDWICWNCLIKFNVFVWNEFMLRLSELVSHVSILYGRRCYLIYSISFTLKI